MRIYKHKPPYASNGEKFEALCPELYACGFSSTGAVAGRFRDCPVLCAQPSVMTGAGRFRICLRFQRLIQNPDTSAFRTSLGQFTRKLALWRDEIAPADGVHHGYDKITTMRPVRSTRR
jgi:hypothetical protein